MALGGHEIGLWPVLLSLADPDRSYVNVGAHVGEWAIRMWNQASRVYAFEANKLTFKKLEANISVNGLVDTVIPVPHAVSGISLNGYFWLKDANGKSTGGSTRLDTEVWNAWAETEVSYKQRASDVRISNPTTTLDHFFKENGDKVGLISMDVEGHEAKVLEGASKLIERDRPNMIIELHEAHPGVDIDIRQQVYALLDEHRYNHYSTCIMQGEEHIIAKPSEKENWKLDVVKPNV